MRSKFISIACLILFVAVQAGAVTYSGSLSYSDSIDATGVWTESPLSMSWTISENVGGDWHYSYTYSTGDPFIHDVFIETPTSFNSSSLSNVTYGAFTANSSYNIATYNTGSDATRLTNLPEEMYGIRFTIVPASATTFAVEFDSDYAPGWGDFYANCTHAKGALNSAWNLGFTSSDFDPTAAAQNGTVSNSILVPTPEPTTIALIGLGFAFVRRRK